MKNFLILLVAVASTPAIAGDLGPVAFLRGCWGATNEHGSKVTEDWFKNSGDTMLGVAQMVSAGNLTVNHEFLTISWDHMKKKISYQGIIDGLQVAPFTYDASQSNTGSDARAVLVNPENDFPQVISYKLAGTDALGITLRGPGEDGQPMEFSYELKKEDCRTRF